ncbi:MAG: TIGR03766 family XrtG-associated glycosyltransferase [Oenococcus sp.]|uniref:TIGR03766 family XrtG-associated glycosyltransferase n=1 Tax=Oenococcus sp. TaxID=1979414 RepID=UPI0039E78D23
MKKKHIFFNQGNKLIFVLFSFFIFVTLYFAIVSPNLVLGDTPAGDRTTWVSVLFLILVVAAAVALFVDERVRRLFVFVFIKRRLLTSSLLLALVICGQVVFVWLIHPAIGFDPGAIHQALTDTSSNELRAYFSLSTNNVMLMLTQHQMAVFFSNTSWLLFDWISLFFVDLSALINIVIIAILDRKKIANVIYIQAVWLVLFPMIVVPYSDTWVLPWVSLYILSYCIIFYSKFNLLLRILSAILGGFALSMTYLLKPSAIVPFIAILLVEFLFLFNKNQAVRSRRVLSLLLISLLLFVSSAASYVTLQHANISETYMKVDWSRSMPPIHFISMGMSGKGGYNPKDNIAMAELPTKKEKTDYSVKLLKQRLGRMGPFGYAKFLLYKQNNNASDGTFAWLIEGHFMSAKPNAKGFKGVLQSFVYPGGKHLGDFRYIAQFIWIIWLALIAFGWRNKAKFTQMLRLAIVGGFLYLLIFEGGRSRYLIQFLPAYILLASLVLNDTVNMVRQKFAWVNAK